MNEPGAHTGELPAAICCIPSLPLRAGVALFSKSELKKKLQASGQQICAATIASFRRRPKSRGFNRVGKQEVHSYTENIRDVESLILRIADELNSEDSERLRKLSLRSFNP